MVTSITDENLKDFESAFAGQSGVRISVEEFEGEFNWKDIHCPSVQPENSEDFMDSDLEAEIMKEILEEQEIKSKEEDDKKKTKKKKKKKSNK